MSSQRACWGTLDGRLDWLVRVCRPLAYQPRVSPFARRRFGAKIKGRKQVRSVSLACKF